MDPIPEGSLILTSFNLQYQTLYTRPDLRIIPSCEMGFSKEKISKEYVQFFNSGFITPLSHKVGVEYFLENKDIYINPKQGSSLI